MDRAACSIAVKFCTVLLLTLVALAGAGCSGFFARPGKTTAEGSRAYLRHFRVNNQQMMADIDSVLLIDEPTRLNSLRLP